MKEGDDNEGINVASARTRKTLFAVQFVCCFLTCLVRDVKGQPDEGPAATSK